MTRLTATPKLGPRVAGWSIAGIALGVVFILGTPAAAATIAVATTTDTSAVACTLRDAITAANTDAASGACSAGAGDDTVDLTGVAGTIALGATLPDLASNVQVHGPGAANLTLDGQDTVPVLHMTGGTVAITDLTIARGFAGGLGRGGGIEIAAGTLGLARVVVRDCGAFNGGGISHDGGTLTIEDSTIHHNRTTGNSGAGIAVTQSMLVLRNTTVANNTITTSGRVGGGLLQSGGTATITSCTFAYNTIVGADGAAIINLGPTGTIHLVDTLIGNNDGGANCAGAITSDGHNLSDDGTCGLSGPGDLPSTVSGLGDLDDNGGATPTIAIPPGSAAADAGDPAACPPADQRGVGRPVDGNGDGVPVCDIGAFEVGCGEVLAAGTPCGPDATPCTDDVCDGAGTCQHTNNTAPCEDGNACTLGDTCANGICGAGSAVTCPVVGSVTYQECLSGELDTGPAGTNACAVVETATSFGANSGLDNLRAVAASPDGKSLYAASGSDHGVARFDRDPTTGSLLYRGCITGELTMVRACTEIGTATLTGQSSGLDATLALALSADGKSLYTASAGDDAVARFDRDPVTGALTYQGCISSATETGPAGTNACAQVPVATAGGTASGLDSARAVAVSTDGASLYAVAVAAVVGFDRDPASGALTYQGCISGATELGPTGTNACALLPIARSDGVYSGLNDPSALALSPDGRSLYVASELDDAVVRFDRDPTTGALTYRDCISGAVETGPTGTGACTLIGSATPEGENSGLDGLAALAVSPDGKSLYAGAELDDAIARFDRDPASGVLTYRGCLTGELESGTATPAPGSGACAEIPGAILSGTGSGLAAPSSVAVSADGSSVYVASSEDDAVAHFVRDPATGALTYDHCLTGAIESGPLGTNACHAIGSAASFGDDSGLDGPVSVALGADGRSLYTAAANDAAVAHFTLEPPSTAPTVHPIGGKLLLIRDPAARKRKLAFVAKDRGIDTTAGSGIDPLADGAVLQVFNAAGTGESACFQLPAAGWSAKGKGAKRTLRYRDKRFAQGACSLATIRTGKALQVACRSKTKPIDYSLDEPAQGSVAVRFRSGGTEYCTVFGGTIAKDRQKEFRAKRAPAPETCPAPPVACR